MIASSGGLTDGENVIEKRFRFDYHGGMSETKIGDGQYSADTVSVVKMGLMLLRKKEAPHDRSAYIFTKSIDSDAKYIIPCIGDAVTIQLRYGVANGIVVNCPCSFVMVLSCIYEAFFTGRDQHGIVHPFIPCLDFNGDDQLKFMLKLIECARWVAAK